MKPLYSFFLMLAATCLSAVFLEFLMFPYVWIFLIFAITLISIAITTKHKIWKLITLNLALVSLVFLLFESILWLFSINDNKSTATLRYSNSSEYFLGNVPHLGYAPKPSMITTSHSSISEAIVYDVTYSINDAGLRVTPPARSPEAPAVLFFGGSFTFGEGVNDDEAMPARVAEQSAYAYNVFNFGFHGYGPHQMLSALENGLVEEALGGATPKAVFYQAIPAHPARSAGLCDWDLDGPMYVLTKEREVQYAGTFDKIKGSSHFEQWLLRQIKKSLIGRKLFPRCKKPGKADVDLTVAIVARSQEIVKAKWPQAEFYVLFWWDHDFFKISSWLFDGLQEQNVNLHLISKAIPDISRNKSKYEILNDGHPNAKAYDIIADYVVEDILNEKYERVE